MRSISVLYEAVFQNPSEVSRRLVLSDALLEAGDVRGEFIALQLHRAKQSAFKPTRREQVLLKANATKWLGRLGRYLKAPRFEEGFVSEATLLAVPFQGDDAAWGEWVTLKALTIGTGSPVALLSRAKLHSLRAVHRLAADDLVALTRAVGRLPYMHIGLRLGGSLAQLVGLESALPSLKSLSVSNPNSSMGGARPYFEDLKPFLNTKIFSSLRDLSMGVELGEDFERLLDHASRSKHLLTLVCDIGDAGTVARVDFKAKRVDLPSDLSDVNVPKVFTVSVGGPSKTAIAIARIDAEWQLLEGLKRVEEWDLAWRVEYKQPMTKEQKALIEALKSGTCRPESIDAWRRARPKQKKAARAKRG